jgi:hypothetical protein
LEVTAKIVSWLLSKKKGKIYLRKKTNIKMPNAELKPLTPQKTYNSLTLAEVPLLTFAISKIIKTHTKLIKNAFR